MSGPAVTVFEYINPTRFEKTAIRNMYNLHACQLEQLHYAKRILLNLKKISFLSLG